MMIQKELSSRYDENIEADSRLFKKKLVWRRQANKSLTAIRCEGLSRSIWLAGNVGFN